MALPQHMSKVSIPLGHTSLPGLTKTIDVRPTSTMFLIVLDYKVPLEQVDPYVAEHMEWVDAQYDQGVFLASGPMEPRAGGVIFATGTLADLQDRLQQDPFYRHDLAYYRVIEFRPRRVAAGYENLLG